MNELKDTVDLMLSEDYKDRFKAEYYQTKIRYDKLRNMYNNWDSLNFTPTCDKGVYFAQLRFQKAYLGILEDRAEIEGVEL